MSHKSNKYERAKEEERRLKKVYKETKTRFMVDYNLSILKTLNYIHTKIGGRKI